MKFSPKLNLFLVLLFFFNFAFSQLPNHLYCIDKFDDDSTCGYLPLGSAVQEIEGELIFMPPLIGTVNEFMTYQLETIRGQITSFNSQNCVDDLVVSGTVASSVIILSVNSTITSSEQIIDNSSVEYNAGESISLNAEFCVEAGAEFDAYIRGCILNPIQGCTYPIACNYDANAQIDDGSCDFGETSCPDPCNAILGCTDPLALNFYALANCDNGGCIYNGGCTHPDACNFDPTALFDDGSCNFFSCLVDLELNKSVNIDEVNAGDQVTFTISVMNEGPGPATGVQATDKLPTGLTYVSHTTTYGSYNQLTGIWNLGGMYIQQQETLTITAIVSQGTHTNIAEITAVNEIDIDSGIGNGDINEDDQDSATVTGFIYGCTHPDACNFDPTASFDDGSCNFFSCLVDLELNKFVNIDEVNAGDQVTFTISVMNEGPSPATGVQATDKLPTGLTYVSHTTTYGSYNQLTGIWNLGGMYTQQQETLTITAIVSQGTHTNIAEITAVNQIDIDSGIGNGDINEDDQDDATVTGF